MLHFVESCGHLASAQIAQKWDLCTSDIIVNATGGVGGGPCYEGTVTAYTGPRLVKALTCSPANIVVFGWMFYANATFPLDSGITWLLAAIHGVSSGFSNSTKQLSINLGSTGTVYVRRGNWDGTTLGTSSTTPITGTTYLYIEVEVTIHPTAGAISILVDNVPCLTLSGLNTAALGTAVVGAVELVPWRVGHIYLVDKASSPSNPYTGFFGKGFRVVKNAMSAAVSTAWVPPSGKTNLQGISDATPDGDKNSTVYDGATDLFTPTALSASISEIYAVQGNAIAQKASSALEATVLDIAVVDGVTDEAAAQALAVSSKDYRTIRARMPDGRQWTRAAYNASQRGYKRVA